MKPRGPIDRHRFEQPLRQPSRPGKLAGKNEMTAVVRRGNMTVYPFTSTETSAEALTSKPSRVYLIIQNKSLANSIFVNFGNKADTNHLEIPAGGSYEPLVAPTGSINIISDTGGGAISTVLIEGIDTNYDEEIK